MLKTKEVEVGLKSQTIKWYEEKGYIIPRRKDKYGNIRVKKGTKIKVKVEDLSNTSHIFVDIVCDECNKELTDITWQTYLKCVKEDGKYYCQKCSLKLYGTKKATKARLKNSISFEQWCFNNLSIEKAEEILSRWDYDKNIDNDGEVLSPNDISFSSNGFNKKGYWFKCLDHIEHISELKYK